MVPVGLEPTVSLRSVNNISPCCFRHRRRRGKCPIDVRSPLRDRRRETSGQTQKKTTTHEGWLRLSKKVAISGLF